MKGSSSIPMLFAKRTGINSRRFLPILISSLKNTDDALKILEAICADNKQNAWSVEIIVSPGLPRLSNGSIRGRAAKPISDIIIRIKREERPGRPAKALKYMLIRPKVKKRFFVLSTQRNAGKAADDDEEGLPVSLTEAMAGGIPVISTCHSGIAEIVENDVSGFLVRERDVEALAQRQTDMLDHPERRPGTGRRGREKVKENQDGNKLIDRLEKTYSRLISEASK